MTMDAILEKAAVVRSQNWPATVAILLVVAVAAVLLSAGNRVAFPKTAPTYISRGGYPILGMWRFFSDRHNFMLSSSHSTKTGNFSFYFGKHQIVGLAGTEGRRTFFDSKDLNFAVGYAVLFANTPQIDENDKDENPLSFNRWFTSTIVSMMRKEKFVRILPILVGDTQKQLAAIVKANGGKTTGIVNPFDNLYRTVYQLTMRTVGADDIAEDPVLLAKTLRLFEQIDAASSPTRVVFPWLPTPGHIKRVTAGIRLYSIFNNIAENRRKTGRRGEDALQFLLDSGESITKIVTFVLGALFGGQLNSGINAAWFFVCLACNPEWYKRVQDEVDAAVARHRASPEQSANDVLATLAVEHWESEFPMVDLCLRECIRFQLVGTAFRKNITDKDIPIGNTGEIIPRGAFAAYPIDDVHMNPDIYHEPLRWDPGRYLPDRAEDKKHPMGYVGWGTGRHPCLGMRFAKLEMSIIAACFAATFDYELLNAAGEKMTESPLPNRNHISASPPDEPVQLRYTVRSQ